MVDNGRSDMEEVVGFLGYDEREKPMRQGGQSEQYDSKWWRGTLNNVNSS